MTRLLVELEKEANAEGLAHLLQHGFASIKAVRVLPEPDGELREKLKTALQKAQVSVVSQHDSDGDWRSSGNMTEWEASKLADAILALLPDKGVKE